MCENFHAGYRDLGRRNRDLGNRVGPPPSNFYKENRSQARILVTGRGLSRSTVLIMKRP